MERYQLKKQKIKDERVEHQRIFGNTVSTYEKYISKLQRILKTDHTQFQN